MPATIRQRVIAYLDRWEPIRASFEIRKALVSAIPITLDMYTTVYGREEVWNGAKHGFIFCVRKMEKYSRETLLFNRDTWSYAADAFMDWMRNNPKYR
jgi:hypothetical protein